MAWFTALNIFSHHKSHPPTLGILTFEAAKAMSRLLNLYTSLSDDQFFNLLKGPLKSIGVGLLNSPDQVSMISLLFSEKIAELDSAVAIISNLALKCSHPDLNPFDAVYAEIKRGNFTLRRLQFNSKFAHKTIHKMHKYVAATCILQETQESLRDMEIWESKLYNKVGCPSPHSHRYHTKTNYANEELLHEKMANVTKQLQRWREASPWNQTFDNIVALMAPIVSVIYAQICLLFGPFVPTLCSKKFTSPYTTHHHKLLGFRILPEQEAEYCLLSDRYKHVKVRRNRRKGKSCPIPKTTEKKKKKIPLFYRTELCIDFGDSTNRGEHTTSVQSEIYFRKGLLCSAPASTVGGVGLASPYANAIVLAESFFHSPLRISDEGRGHIYGLLTDRVRGKIKEKMKRKSCYRDATESDGRAMAEGCRETVETTLRWLGPMAQDTLKWQNERYLEQQKLDAKPTVSLLQTLYFADLEKTEAAIVDVLVGLSCIFAYKKRYMGGARLL